MTRREFSFFFLLHSSTREIASQSIVDNYSPSPYPTRINSTVFFLSFYETFCETTKSIRLTRNERVCVALFSPLPLFFNPLLLKAFKQILKVRIYHQSIGRNTRWVLVFCLNFNVWREIFECYSLDLHESMKKEEEENFLSLPWYTQE